MSIAEQLDRIEQLKANLKTIMAEKGAALPEDASFDTLVDVAEEQFGPAVVPEGGVISYYPFTEECSITGVPTNCTAEVVDEDLLKAFITSHMERPQENTFIFRWTSSTGAWTFSSMMGGTPVVVELEDAGVDATINDGATSANFRVKYELTYDTESETEDYVFDKTGESALCTSSGSFVFSDGFSLPKVTVTSIEFTSERPFYGTVGDNFVRGCSHLGSVSGLGTITTFGDYAFAECTQLVSLDISPAAVGNNFISSCTSFNQEIDLSSLVTVGNSFMSYCTSFNQEVDFSSLATAGFEFMYHCTSFSQDVEFPALATVGNNFMVSCLVQAASFGSLTSCGTAFMNNNQNLVSVYFGQDLHPDTSTNAFVVSWDSPAFAQGITIAAANSAIAQEWTDYINHSNYCQRANTEHGLPTVYYTAPMSQGGTLDAAEVSLSSAGDFQVSWGDGTFGNAGRHIYQQNDTYVQYIKLIPLVDNALLRPSFPDSYPVLRVGKMANVTISTNSLYGVAVGDAVVGDGAFYLITGRVTSSSGTFTWDGYFDLQVNILFKNTPTIIPDNFFANPSNNSRDPVIANGHTFVGLDWGLVEEIGDSFFGATINKNKQNKSYIIQSISYMPKLKKVGDKFLSAVKSDSYGSGFSGFNYPQLESVGSSFMEENDAPTCTLNLPKLKDISNLLLWNAGRGTWTVYFGSVESVSDAGSSKALAADSNNHPAYRNGIDVYCASQNMSNLISQALPNTTSNPYRKLRLHIGVLNGA